MYLCMLSVHMGERRYIMERNGDLCIRALAMFKTNAERAIA